MSKRKQEAARRYHRVQGLLMNLTTHVGHLELEGNDTWGDIQELRDMEVKLGYMLARFTEQETFNEDEHEAVNRVLRNVDPQGEADFS